MWQTFKCLIDFHDWKYIRSHLPWGEDFKLRRCRHCRRQQRSFKNYAKGGHCEWLDID